MPAIRIGTDLYQQRGKMCVGIPRKRRRSMRHQDRAERETKLEIGIVARRRDGKAILNRQRVGHQKYDWNLPDILKRFTQMAAPVPAQETHNLCLEKIVPKSALECAPLSRYRRPV